MEGSEAARPNEFHIGGADNIPQLLVSASMQNPPPLRVSAMVPRWGDTDLRSYSHGVTVALHVSGAGSPTGEPLRNPQQECCICSQKLALRMGVVLLQQAGVPASDHGAEREAIFRFAHPPGYQDLPGGSPTRPCDKHVSHPTSADHLPTNH